jgi:hypothetical protein
VPPTDLCAALRTAQAQFNAQITAFEAAVVQALPADQRAAVLAQLETTRAQANAQLAILLAGC